MQNIHLHGDITLYPTSSTKQKNAESKKLHVLQASGVTGNRHEVVCNLRGVNVLRWTQDGREFVACAKAFTLQHVGGDAEHGKQHVQAGTYEVKRELEHDPWKNELRVVID